MDLLQFVLYNHIKMSTTIKCKYYQTCVDETMDILKYYLNFEKAKNHFISRIKEHNCTKNINPDLSYDYMTCNSRNIENFRKLISEFNFCCECTQQKQQLLKEINDLELNLNIKLDDYLTGKKEISNNLETQIRNYCKRKIKENNDFSFNDFFSLYVSISDHDCKTISNQNLMNSSQWNAFIKSCLDILRNGQSKFDGIKAINEFITLITLKLIENRITDELDADSFYVELNESVSIPIGDDCKMTYLYNNFCVGSKNELVSKANQLFDLLYNLDRVFDITQEINYDTMNVISENRVRNTKKECVIYRFNKYTDYLSHVVKNVTSVNSYTTFTQAHASDVQQLIIKIHNTFQNIDLNHFEYDAFGEAYEKMIADELGNSSKRHGQYFTKRDLINIVIDELNVKNTDVCYDPSCGTGGFILGFANKHKNDINYLKNNIYGQEILNDVHKTLCFNLLSHKNDACLEHIYNGDSITIQHHNRMLNKCDKIGANPPYGMSIDVNIEDYPIKVKNSTALFLQHIYFSLKEGGEAGVVIDRGILNNGTDKKNSWEGNLRKFLCEKCSIWKIIELPTGIFKHTNFATSVIFFKKGTQTTNIKYIKGYFKASDKDKILYLDEGQDITINQIKAKKYSLRSDDYFKQIEEKDTNKWIKLGDVCKSLQKSKRKAGDADINGEFNFYTSSIIAKKSNYNDYKNETIIIGSGGNGSIFMDNNFSCSADNFLISSSNTNKLINKFAYYYLKINFAKLYKLYKGNGLKHLSQGDLLNFLIPKISLDDQTEIVNYLDNLYLNADINLTVKYMSNYDIFDLLLEKKYSEYEEIIYYQEQLPMLSKILETNTRHKTNYIQSLFTQIKYKCKSHDDYQIMKLGDIVKYLPKKFKLKTSDAKLCGKYRFYSSSQNKILYYDECEFNEKCILLGRGGIASVHLAKDFCISHDDVYVLQSINNKFLIEYIYEYLSYNKHLLLFTGNGLKHLSKLNINVVEIPVPPLDIQKQLVKQINHINLPSSHYQIYAKCLEQEIININQTIRNMTSDISDQLFDISDKLSYSNYDSTYGELSEYVESLNLSKSNHLNMNHSKLDILTDYIDTIIKSDTEFINKIKSNFTISNLDSDLDFDTDQISNVDSNVDIMNEISDFDEMSDTEKLTNLMENNKNSNTYN